MYIYTSIIDIPGFFVKWPQRIWHNTCIDKTAVGDISYKRILLLGSVENVGETESARYREIRSRYDKLANE